MTKKSRKTSNQPQSPATYIRQKARKLPIYECLVNEEWRDSKMVYLIISRRHSNGNITSCTYLVDLFSRGVKDTFHHFNVPQFKYEEFIKSIEERTDTVFEKIDYALAHNIVFAGVEYAEDLGLAPHKNFSSITRFMLEEDTDDIELIDVECGLKGKPAFMTGPDDNPVESMSIIRKIEKAVGRDNFTIIDVSESDNYDEHDNSERDFIEDDFDEDDLMAIYKDKSIEEKIELLKDFMLEDPNQLPKTSKKIELLINSVAWGLGDKDQIEEFFIKFGTEAVINGTYPFEVIPEELWGVHPDTIMNWEQLKREFCEIAEDLLKNQIQAKKSAKRLKNHKRFFSSVPIFAVLEILVLKETENKSYPAKLREYHQRYPDYQMINMMWEIENLLSKRPIKMPNPRVLSDFFPGREFIHPLEFYMYLYYRVNCLIGSYNISQILAFLIFLYKNRELLSRNQFKNLVDMSELLKTMATLKSVFPKVVR